MFSTQSGGKKPNSRWNRPAGLWGIRADQWEPFGLQ